MSNTATSRAKGRPQSSVAGRVVAWLRFNAGEHTAVQVAAGLGCDAGSPGALTVMSACRNLQRSMSIKGRMVDGRTKVYERVIRAAEVADAGRRSPASRDRVPVVKGDAETVEAFLARGGQVDVLPGFEVVKPWAAGIPARLVIGTGARAL